MTMTLRRLSPIEMMIDQATGFRPGMVKERPMVTLRCPTCSRKMRVLRDRTDPKRAFYVEAPCDQCDRGGDKPETTYWDALNRQINPATGKQFRRADGETGGRK